MEQLNECLACGTMTGETSRLCSQACEDAMYDSIKIEYVFCEGCGKLATHEMQGVGDSMASVCGECCDACDEKGCTFDATKKLGCGCVGYCLPEDHTPNENGGTVAGLAKLMFG